jgi:hypothetical protein
MIQDVVRAMVPECHCTRIHRFSSVLLLPDQPGIAASTVDFVLLIVRALRLAAHGLVGKLGMGNAFGQAGVAGGFGFIAGTGMGRQDTGRRGRQARRRTLSVLQS